MASIAPLGPLGFHTYYLDPINTPIVLSTRRIRSDLKEVQDAPISKNITVAPVGDSLLLWHGNICIPFESSEICIHFSLSFPYNYPFSPPSLLLLTPLPHANVFIEDDDVQVCLDSLDPEMQSSYRGWSTSRTARSLLIELEALLTDPNELNNLNLGTMADAKAVADMTVCPECGHSKDNIWPPFPQDLTVQRQTTNFRKLFYPKNINIEVSEMPYMRERLPMRLQEFPNQLNRLQLARYYDVKRNSRLQEISNAALFGRLPTELIQSILFQSSSPKDACKLGATCRFLQAYAADSYYWKSVFKRDFPHSEIAPCSKEDWLDGYIQEANLSGTPPTCSVLGFTWREDILGMPAFCTKNSRGKYTDQMLVDYELISGKAYFWSQKTSINCNSNAWCPVYINQAHFIRYREIFESTLGVLGSDGSSPTPLYIPWPSLAVLARAMNTSATVLMDCGIHPSENALAAFYALHRLMLAIVDEYPPSMEGLNQNLAALITNSWMKSEDIPSIGVLACLASVSETCLQHYKIFKDAFQREWHKKLLIDFIRKYPTLAATHLGKFNTTAAQDAQFIKKFLEATLLQRRVRAFQFYFLDFLVEKGGLENVRFQTNRLFGRAPIHWIQRLQDFVKQILSTDDLPGGQSMTRMKKIYKKWAINLLYLRPLPQLSLLAGRIFTYLNMNTRAVSDVLLCGESYSSPPKLHHIHLTQTWRWDPQVSGFGNLLYLDASCWVFSFQNRHLGTIDFRSSGGVVLEADGYNIEEETYNAETSGWLGIHHSGDIIRPEIFWGQHDIDVDMDIISGETDVKALIFCASSWSSPLPEFKAAEVNLVSTTHWEERGGGTLYRNNFKDLALLETNEENSSQVLCALWRRNFGAPWEIRKFKGFGSGGLISRPLQNLKVDMTLALQLLK